MEKEEVLRRALTSPLVKDVVRRHERYTIETNNRINYLQERISYEQAKEYEEELERSREALIVTVVNYL